MPFSSQSCGSCCPLNLLQSDPGPPRHPKRYQKTIFEQGRRKVALKSAKISFNKGYWDNLRATFFVRQNVGAQPKVFCFRGWKSPQGLYNRSNLTLRASVPEWLRRRLFGTFIGGVFKIHNWGRSKRGHGKRRNSSRKAIHKRQRKLLRNSSHKELVARHFPLFFRVSRRNYSSYYCAIVAQ